MGVGIRRAHGLGVLVVSALAVAGSVVVAPAAGGTGPSAVDASLTVARIRHLLEPTPGVELAPSVEFARRIQAAAGPDAVGNLTYQGGPVMQAANNSVPIFWMPSTVQDGMPAAPGAKYVSLIERYFDDIGGSPLYQIATQYYQSIYYKVPPKQYIVNSSHRLLAVVDTSAYPAAGPGCAGVGPDCLDDSQIRAKVASVSTSRSLPQDFNTEYYVFLAPHESSCHSATECFYSDTAASSSPFSFCAYHSYFYNAVDPVIYANLPYGGETKDSNHCTALSAFPNDRDADIEINLISHEQLESTTDPTAGAWFYRSTAGEIGDECAFGYGPLARDGGLANEQWHGHYYVVQQEWSNAISGCTQGAAGAPAAPTAVTARSGATTRTTGSLIVTFTNGPNNGSTITRHTATCTSNGGPTKTGAHSGAAAAPIAVAGVRTGRAYRCTVKAINAHGASSPSAPSSPVIIGAPGQPRSPRITRLGAGRLKVAFTNPANNGARITSFSAVCKSSNGGVARGQSGKASPLGVKLLTRGKTYTCTIRATNNRGIGPTSRPSAQVKA